MKILIVDDQSSVHLYFNRMLGGEEFAEHEFFHAGNGQEALELMQMQQIDLMFLDIEMPVMNGIQLLEALALQQLSVKTIVLSAYNEFDYARSCIQYGVCDYLLKPIDITELKEKLHDALKEVEAEKREALVRKMIEAINHPLADNCLNVTSYLSVLPSWNIGCVCCLAGNTVIFPSSENVLLLCATSAKELQISLFQVKNADSWESFRQHLSPAQFGIGMSRLSASAQNILPGMQESIDALEQSFYHYDAYIYNPDSFQLLNGSSIVRLGEKIKEAYCNQDIANIKHYFYKLFDFFQRNTISPEFVRNFCKSLLLQLDDDFTKTFLHIKGTSFSTELRFADAVTLKNTYLRIVLSTLAEMRPENARTDTDIVVHIKEYVDTHFDRDLSLDTLSTHFFISKYQISRIFKKIYEINFSDYVTSVRMKNAAEFLLHTNLKLYDICRRTGYEETSYFSNVFKKFYGVSPSDYKQENEGRNKQ